jgi:hypothetical protein
MEPKKRIVKVDVHVLAYLGDYLKAFKALVKEQTKLISSGSREGGLLTNSK